MNERERVGFLRLKYYLDRLKKPDGTIRTKKEIIDLLLTRCALFQLYVEETSDLADFLEWTNEKIVSDKIDYME